MERIMELPIEQCDIKVSSDEDGVLIKLTDSSGKTIGLHAASILKRLSGKEGATMLQWITDRHTQRLDGEESEIPCMIGTKEALENLSITKSPDRNTGQKTLQDFIGAAKDFEHIGTEAEKDGVDLITVKHKGTGDVYYYSKHLQYKTLVEQVDDIGEYRCGWAYLKRW